MALVINIKSKQQEKKVKAFLDENDIDYSKEEEDAVVYRTRYKKRHPSKEKALLQNLKDSVDFVNKYKNGKTKTKSLNQLLNEL